MNRNIAVCGVALAALLLAAPQAFAQATDAGTKVTNSASVTYKIGTITQTPPTAGSADFFVDRKVDLSVSSGSYATGVAPGSSDQDVSFSVTNDTNDVIDIALTATNMAANTVYKGADLVNATDDKTASTLGTMTFKLYQADGTTELDKTSGGQYYLDQVAKGTTQTVIVRAQTMATSLVDGDILVVRLTGVAHSGYTDTSGLDSQHGAYNTTSGLLEWVVDAGDGSGDPQLGAVLSNDAASADDSTVVDNVFADGTDDDSADVQNNGQDASYAGYEIGGAEITVTKSSTVYWDPINLYGDASHKPKAIPGAMVLYCIAVKNDGSTAADAVTVTDNLVTGIAFEKGLTDTVPDVVGDSNTTGLQPLDPDGSGTTHAALDATTSLRFSTSASCTAADWDAAGVAAGSSVEDSDAEASDADNKYGNVTGSALTTTVTSLAGSGAITTTMFLVKID